MNIAQLVELGGLVPAELVPQDISWKTTDAAGKEVTHTFTVLVKLLAYGDYERLFDRAPIAQESGTLDHDRRSYQSQLISVAIRLGENGEERFTYEQAYQLQPSLATALVSAINKVNGRSAKKSSPPPTSSGTSSSSTESADAPSPKPNET